MPINHFDFTTCRFSIWINNRNVRCKYASEEEREREELSLHTNLRHNTQALEIYSMYLFMAWCSSCHRGESMPVNCLASQPPYIKLFRNLLATIEVHIKKSPILFSDAPLGCDVPAPGPGWSVVSIRADRPWPAEAARLVRLWPGGREPWPRVSPEGSRGRRGRHKIWKLSGDSKSDPVSVGVLSFHGKVKVKPGSRPLVGFSVEFSKCSHRRWPSYWR